MSPWQRSTTHRIVPPALAALLALCLALVSCAAKSEPKPEPPAQPPEAVEAPVEKPKAPPPVAELVDSPPRLMYATGSNIRLYSGPDTKAPAVSTLRKGDKVRRMKRRGGFAYVKVVRNGLKGWVVNARLSGKPVPKPEPKERAPEIVRERIRQGGSPKESEAVIFENF